MEAWYRILHRYITGQTDTFNNVFARVANNQSGWISLAKREFPESKGEIEAAFKVCKIAFIMLPPKIATLIAKVSGKLYNSELAFPAHLAWNWGLSV